MVCCQEIISSSSEDHHHQFQLWKDFPKGLRVLLVCNDAGSASQTQTKLEHMDYIVSWYSNFEEAQNVITEGSGSFHVAIVEVTSDNCPHSYKFLEAARNLPVIVISSDSSLSTMMKCIALGAAEFLQKPLSEEKLRNIWQHVIHKAFSSSDKCETELRSLKPSKEMVASMIHSSQNEKVERSENDVLEKLTRPSTPQLESKLRIPSSNNEESEERYIKSVKNTCNDSVIAPNNDQNLEAMELRKHEEEVNSLQISKSDASSSVKEVDVGNIHLVSSKKKKISSSFKASKDYKKKSKVDWTPELHKRFVKAVEQLGVDQAIPSKILELMKVEGLTRHNVASHLQKYRMHRRYILPKQEARWPVAPRGTACLKSYMQGAPFIASPPPVPFHHQHYPAPPFAPWYQQIQHQSYYYHPFQPWQPPVHQNWPWNSYPAINADTWGCPVYPPYMPYSVPPPMAPPTCTQNGLLKESSNEFYLIAQDEEVIDKIVKEALAEPWAPLPLGLNPPSTDSILSELHRLGIHTVISPVLPATTARTSHNLL